MKLIYWLTVTSVWLAILVGVSCVITGCSQIEVETEDLHVKINTLFKDIEFDEFIYGDVKIRKYDGTSKNITAITPYGTISTEGNDGN